jgi:hypothetical protein
MLANGDSNFRMEATFRLTATISTDGAVDSRPIGWAATAAAIAANHRRS